MDALEAILTRNSPRAVGAPEVSRDHLAQVLDAAVRAPDHGKLRPWRFILIEGDDRLKFGEQMAQSLLRRNPEATEGALEAERAKALRAPLIIVVAARTDPAHAKIPEIEQLLAVGASAQNIMVALHALGYGAMWKTGDAAYDPALKQAIGLRAEDHVVGFIYAGTTSSALPPKSTTHADYMLSFGA